MISKQQFEAQLQHIFRLLLENKTQEEISHELNISTRTVARYSSHIDKRYGEIQRQKTDNTLLLECHLFKNRILNLYKALETKVLDDKTSGVETAKCAEIAASIALDVLKLESEGIKAVKNGLVSIATATAHNNAFNNLGKYDSDDDYNDVEPGNSRHNQNQQHKEDNRKF
jgi:hypothetical protein